MTLCVNVRRVNRMPENIYALKIGFVELRSTYACIWRIFVSWWRHQMETFPRYWPFVRGIHCSLVNSPHNSQWRGVLIFLFNQGLIKWLSKQSRRHRDHHDVTVMCISKLRRIFCTRTWVMKTKWKARVSWIQSNCQLTCWYCKRTAGISHATYLNGFCWRRIMFLHQVDWFSLGVEFPINQLWFRYWHELQQAKVIGEPMITLFSMRHFASTCFAKYNLK